LDVNRRIKFILILTIFCTLGLPFLQGYWNYAAYKQASKTFNSDINSALKLSINEEAESSRRKILKRYETWLRDSSFIVFGTIYIPATNETTISIADRYPPPNDNRKPFNIGFGELKLTGRIEHVTPETKSKFIKIFVYNQINSDLKKQAIYYYTYNLGDSLSRVLRESRVDTNQLSTLYKKALLKYDIDTDFILETGPKKVQSTAFPFTTRAYKAGIFSKTEVKARFRNPALIVLTQMKWLLIGSVLLISITIFCFIYTSRTLLSQKKLAELKNDFVNNMAHELNTPIATIKVAAEAIQEFKLSPQSVDDYMGIIRQQAESLTYLTDQILSSLVREEVGLKPIMNKISLNSVVNHCLEQLEPKIQSTGANVIFEADQNTAYVEGDNLHLTSVFTNLVDNALKYGNTPGHIKIELLSTKNCSIIQTTNAGEGIKPEYYERIFDRFYRIPTGNLHNVKGYGLGLTYVRQIIELHGGNIRVESSQSSNTFIITLPLLNEPASGITS
jgi:two-component system, OmpR family, phosphate regulon sensor histidine kinase PhoR